MITIGSLSGGESSSYMEVFYPSTIPIFSVVCIDKGCSHKTDTFLKKYAQEKFSRYCPNYSYFEVTAEQDSTLLAMIDLEQYIGREIVWVRGEGFDSILNHRHMSVLAGNKARLPSWARRYCTEKMKLLPIFEYLYFNGLTPCNMNIGFRADETTDRCNKFYFRKDGTTKNPHFFHYPISSNNFGQYQQNWANIYYRRAHFPLKKNGITKDVVQNFWKGKINFPKISNCVGCFHKNIETISVMCHLEPQKMKWFMEQEKKDMGTWRDDRITYERISNSKIGLQLSIEEVSECESEGCGV